jgi:hypothetical protein
VKAQGRSETRETRENNNKPGIQADKRLELKKQLRLDLSVLRGDSSSYVGNQILGGSVNQSSLQKLNGNLQQLNLNPENIQKGFHEEFMAKLNEFSESWRQAALLEKKF